ncbi:MAG: hypothetical protein IH616_22825 [Gemmatimonadales bacterium]|jgi:hypothetical protein|nr:hypothetical protein [Gemmatimonadales bacterium]
MRYFHRTSLSPDEAIAEADRHFGSRLQTVTSGARSRIYEGTVGTITVQIEAEGGHYTHITVSTDQVGESEADKTAKRFLTMVHARGDGRHVARGAY